MEVNINNLRRQAAYALDAVIKQLNEGIMPEKCYEFHEIDGEERQFYGDILVSKDDLEDHLNDLRHCIQIMLCTYEKDNPDFKDLSDEVGGIEFFNS